MSWMEIVGMLGALSMPIWNIPLIARIVKRKSSRDISLAWVIGVWVCVLAMLPSSIVSSDRVLKIFGITNAIAFTLVFIMVLKYHKPCEEKSAHCDKQIS